MADLSSLTADQLAEKTRWVVVTSAGVTNTDGEAEAALAAIAELVRRLKTAEDALAAAEQRASEWKKERDIAIADQQVQTEAAEQRAADEKARYAACCEEREEIKRLTTYKTIGELQARAVQAEQERDICRTHLADLQAAFRTHSDALQAAEKERDEARGRYEFWHEKATEYVIQARGAEARLAETQKALEQIAMERPWPDVVMVDLVQVARDTLARSRAALTIHHTEAGDG